MQGKEDLSALRIERAPVRSYKGSRVPWRLLLVLAAIAGGIGWANHSIFGAPLVELGPVFMASAIASANGKEGAAWTELNAAGYVVADRQSTVAAKYTARLEKLHVREASRVKRGDVLAELDHKELDAQIAQAQAEAEQAAAQTAQSAALVEVAAAQVEQARQSAAGVAAELAAARAPMATHETTLLELEVLLADANRRLLLDRELLTKNAGAATHVEDRMTEVRMTEARIATARNRRSETERAIQVAEAGVQSAQAAILTAEAQAKSAAAARDSAAASQRAMQARLKVLETQRDDFFIRSPFDGVITERIAEEGEIVAPVSVGGTMAKGAIVTVADWESLQAEVDVAEAYLERVKPGGRAAITVDAIPGKVFAGKVQRILPHADRSKATVQVRVDFLDRDGVFLPDMGVRVKFLPDSAPAGAERGLVPDPLVVPAGAVRGTGDARFVWLAVDQKAVRRPVTLGAARGEYFEVVNGLELGDRVVVQGADAIADDGQGLRVKE